MITEATGASASASMILTTCRLERRIPLTFTPSRAAKASSSTWATSSSQEW
jgi:hypothetical protein